MDGLLEYLKVVNELDDLRLSQIRAHYGLADEIKHAEELKKQAAIDEDYENAAKYKKLIVSLKEQTLTVDKLKQEYLNEKPEVSTKQLLEQMNTLDPLITEAFIQTNKAKLVPVVPVETKCSIANRVLLLSALVSRKDLDLEKVKCGLEDSL